MEAQQPTVNISQEKKKCGSSFNVFPMLYRVREAEQQKKKCSSSSPVKVGHPQRVVSSLPSCLFLKSLPENERRAFLGHKVIFYWKYFDPVIQHELVSNSKVWRAWLEMERRNGNVWQARTEIPLSSPQKLSVNACLQNKPIISLVLSHYFVTPLLSIKLPLLPDIDVTIFCPGLRMFARKHHEKQWVSMCWRILACVWQIIWKGLTRDLMRRSASWDQCW